ncbi:ABC transporter substrate-binding protein [Nesterenkonia sp. CL21]|uniref:ABC transporter substrate-binding protein n=1 Tax=Nesterenkonia sp. CL21 TaxID=3064894 RepID=UPI00287A59A6|nr:ABC transporter substrate-binding protein [Nesterenkonia sp. CL21]MDS2173499.1 ABC transporter substrate-binding protein [Nesterenkonia sp. CL21]
MTTARTTTTRRPRPRALGAAAVGLLALSACGADDGTASEEGIPEGELVEVTVGVLPIAPSVGIYYGIEHGIFEEHGLDVELEYADAGAAMLPAVSTQQYQFGIGNPNSVLNAADQGLDIRIVSGYTNSWAEGDDVAGVIAKADSGIEDWTDLEGASVAINALQTQGDLTIMDSVENAGGDPEAVSFTEMPFPDMPAQLELDNVDAIWVPEPFMSQTLSDDANHLVGHSFQDAVPGMPTMVAFSSGDYVDQNPEVAQAFHDAMREALSAAQADEEGARELLVDFIDMPEEAAMSIAMEEFEAEIRTEEIDEVAALMVKYGFISEVPEMSEIYFVD